MLLDRSRPVFLYNPAGRTERVRLAASAPLAPGPHDVEVRVDPSSSTPRAATLVLSIDGQPVASADVPILYRARGDAYIGRKGVGMLLPDLPLGDLTNAPVHPVDIDIH